MKRITSALCAVFASVATFALADVTIPRPDPSIAEFARGVKFTVAGYNGGAEVQTNFPVLVRLSTAITGFNYNDFYNKSATDLAQIDICFVDTATNALSYDIDEWNPGGVSLVWVNLPVMTNGTEFAMWYRSSKTGKALNPDNVWTNYAGVWHFAEDYGTETASVKVYDSTTNNLTGDTFYDSTKSISSSYTSGGRPGRARKIATKNDPKGIGAITVPLGADKSAKRTAVDKLGEEFSVSFWARPEADARYNYFIGRKDADNYQAWALQQHDNISQWRIYSNGNTGSSNDGYAIKKDVTGFAKNNWTKIDLIYTAEGTAGKYYIYYDGAEVGNGDLKPGKVKQGGLHLYIGGGADGGQCRPFIGEMDEVRLCYSVPTATRIRADFDTIHNGSFLTAGTVVEVAIVERPVVNFSVVDTGASHIQFGGTLSSLGSDQATECEFYAKVWPTADAEPASWTALGSGLTTGAFSGLVKGLTPATAHSYRLKVTNDEGVDSDETSGYFTTSGVGIGGTGGFVTRIGDDWIHYFRVVTDNDSGETTTEYTFTPPSYATAVRALVVAGGGPGGYRCGGGGGAGGYIYNEALGVTGGTAYAVNVGTGGVATASIGDYGANGGDSSIVGGNVSVISYGGGAGGNGSSDSPANVRNGLAGGSGGGSSKLQNSGGTGTAGQGNAGGAGNEWWLAGGGGGASGTGVAGPSTGNTMNAGAGGAGLECDITGIATYYAGGGGGGGNKNGDTSRTVYGAPGVGGNGGGGTGSRKAADDAVSSATSGTDGLGGGGGGGCGDVEAYYKGGDGGDGIVIVRYPSQGDGTAIPQPIVSLQSATCNDASFKGEVTFRVAWAGYGYQDADVAIAWGYAEDSLVHTNAVASGIIGIGTGAFDLIADECQVYLRAVATNAAGVVGVSTETLSFYVADNPLGQDDNTVPGIANVAVERFDGAYAVITGIVTSLGMSAETCTIQALIGTAADNLSVMASGTSGLGAASLVVDGLSPDTTYYYCLKVVDDNGGAASSTVESFTTLGPSIMGAVTPTANQQTFRVSAPLTSFGAGTTYVLVRWSEDDGATWGEFTTIATRTALDAPGTITSPDYRRSSWGSVKYEYVVSNECVTSTGVPNGVAWSETKTGTIAPVDSSTYTWQPVDGDWNGAWSDPAHWSCSKPDNLGYPQCNTATVVFNNNTTATIDVPGDYTFKEFSVAKSGVNIMFVGEGAVVSALRCNITGGQTMTDSSWTFSALRLEESNGIDFGNTSSRNVTLTLTDGTIASVGNSTISMYGSNVWMVVENGASFRNAVRNGTKDGGIRIDDGTVTGAYFRTDYNGNATTNEWFIFSGAAPRLTAASSFRNESNAAQHLQNSDTFFVFSVPVAGWAAAPLYAEYSSSEKLAGFLGDANGKYVVGVDETSDAFNCGGTVEAQLVSWRSGIETNNVSLAEVEGVSYEWTYGWPTTLQEPASAGDAPTGLKAVITGRGLVTASLTIPSPLPDNVSLVSVTTNGFAVDAAEGVYTVLNGATVAITFAPAEDYALVGSETVEVVMDGDTTLSSDLIPTAVSIRPVTLTIPELPSNVTIASVTTNGIAITSAEGVYTVINGASVVVAFEAVSGYVLTGAPTTATVAMDGDVTLSSASIPTAITLRAAISINEIMASNPSLDKGGIANGKGIAEMDWVEFHNASAEDIDITGWFLSDNDKKGKETKATILGHCVVPAGGYEIVWLDKTHIDPAEYAENEGFAILKLSSSGDLIQLADASTNVVDKINFKTKPQIKGYSYGPGTVSYGPYAGTGPYVYMKTATPRAENVTEGWGDFTPGVTFSVPHGWKTEAFDLTLSSASTNAIHYTLDGTSPTTSSPVFSTNSPIHITGTTVVRAAVPIEGSVLQFDSSATYLFLDDILAQGRTTTAPASAVGFPNHNAVNGQDMLYGLNQSVVTGADRDRLLRGFTNSISTLSIVIDPANLFNGSTGIYVNPRGEGVEWERQTMLEIFDPKGSAADVTIPAGIRIRGGNSRNTNKPKHSLRFFFRSEYGQSSLEAKLFPGEGEVGEYDKLDLRTSQNLSWANEGSANDTFVTEVFSRDSQRDMGQPYTRSRYYNLFINGQYWGLYQTQERGDEHFGEAYLGGDSLQYDLIKTASTFVNNSLTYSIECNEGTWDAWTNLFNIAVNEGFGGEYTNNYYKVLGLNPDGTRNPAYPILVNQESLMAYMFATHYVVDQDGPTSPFSGIDKGHANNFYALRNRNDAGTVSGFVFLRHDAEISMGQNGNTKATANPTFWGTENQTSPNVGSPDPTGLGKLKFRTVPYFTPAELHYLLMQNPDYKRAYADAFYKHFLRPGGAMTMEKNLERYTSRMAEIDDAIVCEQARWAQSGQTRTTWLNACGTSLDFITNRIDNMKSQYVAAGWYPSIDAPSATNALGQVFADGDKIEPEDTVHFSGTESGTIYYTTNGIDPRAVDGSVVEDAIAYDPATGAAMPETGALVKARILTGGGEWSALEEVEIDVNLPSDQKLGIRIAAIMSVPKNDPDGEFIVLTNILDRAVSLQGLAVKAEKSTKTPTTLFTITDDIELAAGASIKLKRADYWSSNTDLKLKNNDIIVVIRDLNDKLVQTAIVKADTWFLTTKLDDKGKPIGACKGLGSFFIALEFGEEVVREDQWKASPLPPKPTVFMAY